MKWRMPVFMGMVIATNALLPFCFGFKIWDWNLGASSNENIRITSPELLTPENRHRKNNSTRIVIYNRIGKSGSTTIMKALEHSGCDFYLAARSFQRRLTAYEFNGIHNFITQSNASCQVIVGHFGYAKQLRGENTNYMNIMRDPLERWKSLYCFWEANCVQGYKIWCKKGHYGSMAQRLLTYSTANDCLKEAIQQNVSMLKHCTMALDSTQIDYLYPGYQGHGCARIVKTILNRYKLIGTIEQCYHSGNLIRNIILPAFPPSNFCGNVANQGHGVHAALDREVEVALRGELSCDFRLMNAVQQRYMKEN